MKERTQAERAELEKTAKTATKAWKVIWYSIAALAVVCAFYNTAHLWTALVAYLLGRFVKFEIDN